MASTFRNRWRRYLKLPLPTPHSCSIPSTMTTNNDRRLPKRIQARLHSLGGFAFASRLTSVPSGYIHSPFISPHVRSLHTKCSPRDANGLCSGVIFSGTLQSLGKSPEVTFVHFVGKSNSIHPKKKRAILGPFDAEWVMVMD